MSATLSLVPDLKLNLQVAYWKQRINISSIWMFQMQLRIWATNLKTAFELSVSEQVRVLSEKHGAMVPHCAMEVLFKLS